VEEVIEMIKPSDCIHYKVCKFADDPGCLDGCDFREERDFTNSLDRDIGVLKKELRED